MTSEGTLTQSADRTGSVLVVIVTTTSASRTAASALEAATTRTPSAQDCSEANASRCLGSRLNTRISPTESTRDSASAWVRACWPEPITATVRGPPGAGSNARAATALAAPVRYAPRSEEHTSELQSHSDLVCRLL